MENFCTIQNQTTENIATRTFYDFQCDFRIEKRFCIFLQRETALSPIDKTHFMLPYDVIQRFTQCDTISKNKRLWQFNLTFCDIKSFPTAFAILLAPDNIYFIYFVSYLRLI